MLLRPFSVRTTTKFGHNFATTVVFCPNYHQVRTRICYYGRFLSELPPSSDTILLLRSISVRTTTKFGHNFATTAVFCPNYHQVRTRICYYGRFLSELPLSSDTNCLFTTLSVRTTTKFGHEFATTAVFCPNYHQVRTQFCYYGRFLSELPPSSDTILLLRPFSVRTTTKFGHNFATTAVFCPNYHQVRTQFCYYGRFLSELPPSSDTILLLRPFSVRTTTKFGHNFATTAVFCPNYHQVRTQFCYYGRFLSELPPSSDTILLLRPFSVRTTIEFGHDFATSALFCPNYHRVRTRFCYYGRFLSELPPSSDTNLLLRPFSVRTTTKFGHDFATSAHFCPNYHQVRTRICYYGPFLSELPPSSDTNLLLRPFSVRTTTKFGHELPFTTLSVRTTNRFSRESQYLI